MSVDMVICKDCKSYFSTEDGNFKEINGETWITCPDCSSLNIVDAEMCPLCFEMKPKEEPCPICKALLDSLIERAVEEKVAEVQLGENYKVVCNSSTEKSLYFKVFVDGESFKGFVIFDASVPIENNLEIEAIKLKIIKKVLDDLGGYKGE